MRYIYSTKPEGMKLYCTAKSLTDGVSIAITQEIMASSHTEAADQFEEYLNQYHEGFVFVIEIITEAEKITKNSVVLAS